MNQREPPANSSPCALARRAVTVGLLLCLLSACGVHQRRAAPPLRRSAPAAVVARSPGQLERELFNRANAYRRSRGLSVLALDRRMSKLAREHSRWMASSETLGHRGVNRRFDRLQSAGFLSIAENVAYNMGHRDPAQAAVEGWIGSRGHRRNMTARDDQVAGVGVARSRDGAWYFTQLYGRRQ